MKKLTKHQKQYRKRKKDAAKDSKFIVREDGKRVERVTKRQLCVRVNMDAAQRLANFSKDRNISQGDLLTHMLIWGGGQVYEIIHKDSTPGNQGHIKYKGTTGTKQLNLGITSTAWNRLETYKAKLNLSKARIVQTIILYYTFLTAEQLQARREADQRREELNEWYRNQPRIPPTQQELDKFWEEVEQVNAKHGKSYWSRLSETE